MKPSTVFYTYFDSPVGKLLLAGDGVALYRLSFPCVHTDEHIAEDWTKDDSKFEPVKEQLTDYFAGNLQTFDIPLSMKGTNFQKRVWKALLDIPFGATKSYGDIANALGSPGASRAVGSANNINPIAIIVPCHRVIGSTGKMVGFGGGLETKQFLLDLESPQYSLV